MPDLATLRARLSAEFGAIEKTVAELRECTQGYTRVDLSSSAAERERRQYAERLEEYKFLRTELEAIWNQTYTTLNFILAGMGVMITLAFSERGEPAILLPMASCLGLGGYRLIRLHTTRVWRIVGYMRCALEKNLQGIRWETRLFHRHGFLAAQPRDRSWNRWLRGHLDRDIFDGHVQILDIVNTALIIVISVINYSGKSALMHQCDLHPWRWSFFYFLQMIVPAGSLIWSQWTQRDHRRGEGAEERHINSWWKPDPSGVRAAEAEPPLDFLTPPGKAQEVQMTEPT